MSCGLKSRTIYTDTFLDCRDEYLSVDARDLCALVSKHIPLSGSTSGGVGGDIYHNTNIAINNANKKPKSIRSDSDVGRSAK